MPLANPAIIQNKDRIQALINTKLLNAPPSKVFDRFTDLITHLLDVPISLISLIDEERHFFLSVKGLDASLGREMRLSHSFCQHTVAMAKALVIEDAREHPLVHDNLAIEELDVIAYLGVPLRLVSGHVIGTLCAIDSTPRQWTDHAINTLQKLSEILIREIDNWRFTSPTKNKTLDSFYARILDHIPTPVVVYDLKEKQNIYSNNKLAQFYGYPDMDDKPLTLARMEKIIHPEDLSRLAQHTNPQYYYLQSIENFDVNEYRVRHRDGHWLWTQTYSTISAVDEDGQPHHILSIVLNTTQQKTDQERTLAIALEQEQLRVIRDLVIKISHDIRTPLATIQLNLDMVEYHPDPNTISRRIAAIQRQIKRLVKIMDDLSLFDRMHQFDDFRPTHQDMTPLIKQAIQTTWGRLQPKYDRELGLDLADNLPQVEVDHQNLQTAITSLVENAVYYSSDGDTITVSTQLVDNMIEIVVQDTGAGIAEEHQAKVFDAFYKVNEARTTTDTRSGMGLTLVQKVVERHGGEISLDSIVGEGTTIRIRLPIDTV